MMFRKNLFSFFCFLFLAGGAAASDVRDFGAAGDGETLDTVAIQRAVDAGGIVRFPPGRYLTGTIYLRSNGGLELEPGAVLLASCRRGDYNADDIDPRNLAGRSSYGPDKATGAHLIVALDVENVTIRGAGRIDGRLESFYRLPEMRGKLKLDFVSPGNWRMGQMLYFCDSRNVTLEGVEIVNAPYWSCLLVGCENVMLRGLRITTPRQAVTCDGLDIDVCRNVTVSDCLIDTGDDAIAILAHTGRSREPWVNENITISNCILRSATNAVRLGVGDGVIRRISVSNLIIRDTRNAITVSSRYAAAKRYARIEEVSFDHILFDVDQVLSIANLGWGYDGKVVPEAPIRNLNFSNFHGHARYASRIQGCGDGSRLAGVTLRNWSIQLGGGEKSVSGDPEVQSYRQTGRPFPPAAFYLRAATGVTLESMRIVFDDSASEFRFAVFGRDCPGLKVESVESRLPVYAGR